MKSEASRYRVPVQRFSSLSTVGLAEIGFHLLLTHPEGFAKKAIAFIVLLPQTLEASTHHIGRPRQHCCPSTPAEVQPQSKTLRRRHLAVGFE
ncbi:MAG: hypothetical protein IT422_13410 [Pirellulaceae bacterium]|nr:hypothetical protein [Pirellulaceae bacterium]